MKQAFQYLFRPLGLGLLAVTYFFMAACDDGGGGGPEPPQEQTIAFNIDPDPGTSTATSLSARYDFNVIITSTLPQDGVSVTAIAKRESDNVQVSTQTRSTPPSTVSIYVDNLESGKTYIVEVKATSKTTSTNTKTKTFKVARK